MIGHTLAYTALAIAGLSLVCAASIGVLYLFLVAKWWAEDRKREERMAEEWRATHKAHQDRERYITDIFGRPE